MPTKPKPPKVLPLPLIVPVPIDFETINSLLISAFEGSPPGTADWCSDYVYGKIATRGDGAIAQDGRSVRECDEGEAKAAVAALVAQYPDLEPEREFTQYLLPFCPGYGLILNVDDEEENGKLVRFLDHRAMLAGLTVMARLKEGEGGHHFGDVLGDSDCTTSDVFVQCAVFGKIVYG